MFKLFQSKGMNFFITACKENDNEYVQGYLQQFADKPETRMKYGQSGLFPIHIAALMGSDGVF